MEQTSKKFCRELLSMYLDKFADFHAYCPSFRNVNCSSLCEDSFNKCFHHFENCPKITLDSPFLFNHKPLYEDEEYDETRSGSYWESEANEKLKIKMRRDAIFAKGGCVVSVGLLDFEFKAVISLLKAFRYSVMILQSDYTFREPNEDDIMILPKRKTPASPSSSSSSSSSDLPLLRKRPQKV